MLYCSCLSQLLGQAARNMVIQEDAILHSEDVSFKLNLMRSHHFKVKAVLQTIRFHLTLRESAKDSQYDGV